LAAWFTAENPINTSTLKTQLERFLPKYMVPTYCIQLEKIPLTSSGKVDKKALPHPTSIPDKKTYRSPADYVEDSVLRILSEILQIEKLSMDDNFFEIGGNSLNAVRFISRVQKDLNVNLPLREIFFSPVLLQVAEAVKKLMASQDFQNETMETSTTIIPASSEELKLLSKLQFDDED
jgi:tyrocidine synthetase-3